MPILGGLIGAALGDVADYILDFDVVALTARTIRVRFRPIDDYCDRNYGIYVNGILRRIVSITAEKPSSESIIMLNPGESGGYVYIEDFGDWAFELNDPRAPNAPARANEAVITDKISFTWDTATTFSQGNGYVIGVCADNQISNIRITGMKRYTNCKAMPEMPRRARLDYTIEFTVDGIIITWFNGTTPVAQGMTDATGSGGTEVQDVLCEEVNGSGLTVRCDLDFSGDSSGFVILGWPDSYQIHYSTSTLTFPRTPQVIVYDAGVDDFRYETPALAAGTYNAAIVPVRDGEALSSVSVTSGIVINTIPKAPIITEVSGNANELTVTWVAGEAGCTFKCYSSYPDQPINWGNFTDPAVQSVGLNVLTATLDPIPLTMCPGIVRVSVRATKGGIEELNNVEVMVELDESGNILYPRPNRTSVQRVVVNDLALSVDAVVGAAERLADAEWIDLFIVPSTEEFDFDTPQASVQLTDPTAVIQRGAIAYTVPAPGCYKFCVRARYNPAGNSGSEDAGEPVLSLGYITHYQWFTNSSVGEPSNIVIEARRQAR